MTDTNLPGFCGAIADELERIAADLRKIEHVELPEPRLFQLDIQPNGQIDDEIIATVDTLGTALLGKTGEHDEVSSGPWYSVKGDRGPVTVSVYRGLSKRPDERDAELARLRAEVEQLRAQQSSLAYSRADEADDPTPVSGGRVEMHTGAVTEDGLVDETEPSGGLTPIHFGFLHIGTACGLPAEGSDRRSQVSVWPGVTCEACLKQYPQDPF